MGYDLTQEMCGGVELLEFRSCLYMIYMHVHMYITHGKNKSQVNMIVNSEVGVGMVRIWFNDRLQRQEVDYMEFFAGVGNLTQQMRSAMYRAARFDIKDHTPRNKRSNYMDMNSPAGYAFLSLKFEVFSHPLDDSTHDLLSVCFLTV
jgi:hypothetical protein